MAEKLQRSPLPDESLLRFRTVMAASLAELERRRSEVNDLNVFPVADGDTGDNMAMTMRSVLDEVDRLHEQPAGELGREELAAAVARAALLGARGNSGVILSEILRGAADELAARSGELVDPVLVSAALARAADRAYASVRDPVEGTMLSAVRAMALRAAQDLDHLDPRRLDPGATRDEQDALLAGVLEGALEAGKDAVDRGPEQLAVLREAGVVDAGAYGLTVILAGCVAALRGREEPELEHRAAPVRVPAASEHESSTFRYCTNFAVTGQRLDGTAFVPRLEEVGDSVLVVGDEQTLRVHVHTDEPERAVVLFDGVGEVSRLDVADMREQIEDRSARLARCACSVVAVASGPGLRRLYEELGVWVVEGGSTMNPSTSEIRAGIDAAPGGEVLVLPNSSNVILAAERAAELAGKPARVVPTTAPQEGLAALLAFDADSSAEANAAAVRRATEVLRIGGVARAGRDDRQGRFRVGEAIGYADGELVAWGEPGDVLARTIERLGEGAELLTCIGGEAAPLARADVEGLVPDAIQLEYHDGGQPTWWWLLCAE